MDELFEKHYLTIPEIREGLEQSIGKELHIRANLGRSKILERDGVLTQAHNALFIVEIKEKRGRTLRQSYQYVDILTGMVELTDNETGERLFPDVAEPEEI